MRAQTSQAIKSFDGPASQVATQAQATVNPVPRNASSSTYHNAKQFISNAAALGGMEPIRRKANVLHQPLAQQLHSSSTRRGVELVKIGQKLT